MLWQSLHRALKVEHALGYTDGGVVGGFALHITGLLARLGSSLPQATGPLPARLALWEQQFQNYRRLPLKERRALVEQFSSQLADLAAQEHGPAKNPDVGGGGRNHRRVSTPVQYVRGVGPRRAEQLKRLGIITVSDLLWHLPLRYFDRRRITEIAAIRGPGEVNVSGTIRAYQQRQSRRGLTIFRGTLDDGTGSLPLVWFNRHHLPAKYPPGCAVVVSGKIEFRYGRPELQVGEIESQEEAGLHTTRVVPVYPATDGLNQRFLRGLFQRVLTDFPGVMTGVIPPPVLAGHGLADLKMAFEWVHFPADLAQAEAGRRRLAFEEIFLVQTTWQVIRRQRENRATGFRHLPAEEAMQTFRALLPFALTQAQERVIAEIAHDMETGRVMNRLLQGDVGTGKTVVAAAAVVKAVASGFQAVLMAPTEVLAEQHAIGWQRLLFPLAIPVGHLAGSLGRGQRAGVLQGLAEGSLPVVVGTHALLQNDVRFKRLGLVVIDEQHRFGVRQRATLWGKGSQPDLLVMTATPIPRTLAITLYGDLDVSVLDERPPGRQPVKTYHVGSKAWPRIFNLIRNQVAGGHQVYVICPVIEETAALDLAGVETRYRQLSQEVFADLKVGMLHGRLKKEAKAAVMEAFHRGEIDILVATTVVEVGVDVPNATVMVIEDAERFGLAQLHQLRGRVGRGMALAYCILVADRLTPEGRARMQAMVATNDGFCLAEEDLRLRGPGDLLGTRQSGLLLFKAADMIKDNDLFAQAKVAAQAWLQQDPDLKMADSRDLVARVRQTLHGLDLVQEENLNPGR
ncbi:MAG: ATP-dependent DNA helicase RecG [Heliobacteriaceae bacterium]|nr:ATP-dependent DNA helicase RecG [Heliobacteriaceae bacterium]MDD4586997.1 ATP-dependent DNA helicase RecG [Heliobacteriaceae bacterium]